MTDLYNWWDLIEKKSATKYMNEPIDGAQNAKAGGEYFMGTIKPIPN